MNLCVCVVSRDEPLFAELKTGAGVKVRWAESLEAAAGLGFIARRNAMLE